VLSLALGLGIWTIAAVNLTGVTSDFQEGDVVSASDFNDLFATIDDNFALVADAIADQVAKAGDTMSGRLAISGDTGPRSDGGNAALYAQNTNNAGVSAFFEGDTSEPVLIVRNNGNGPLLQATNGTSGLEVANDGTLRLGTIGSPEIVLDPTTATISGDLTFQDEVTFESGVAFDGDVSIGGDLTVDGTIQDSTGASFGPTAWASWDASAVDVGQKSSNISTITRLAEGEYTVSFTSDVNISDNPVVTVSVRNAGMAETITYDTVSGSNEIDVYVWAAAGAATDSSDWSLVLHQP
jgi:hypothetical protein